MNKFKSVPMLIAAVLCMAGTSSVESGECIFDDDVVVVIGADSENRVIPYAQENHLCHFSPKAFDGASSESWPYCKERYKCGYMGISEREYIRGFIKNCVWINEVMNAHYTVVDIGPVPGEEGPRPFYCLELSEICGRNNGRGYPHRQSCEETPCSPPIDCANLNRVCDI